MLTQIDKKTDNNQAKTKVDFSPRRVSTGVSSSLETVKSTAKVKQDLYFFPFELFDEFSICFDCAGADQLCDGSEVERLSSTNCVLPYTPD